MAKNGFKTMDSDMHVFEPADLWQRYIDSKYADRAPVGLNRSFRDLGIQVEGKILPIPLDPDFAAAVARAYNDWLYDFARTAPERMYGVAMVAPHDVSAAVEEIQRTV